MQFPGEDVTIAAYFIQNPDVFARHEAVLEQYPFHNAFIKWVFVHLKQAWLLNRKLRFPAHAEALLYIGEKSQELPELHRVTLGEAVQIVYTTEISAVTTDRVLEFLIRQRSDYLQDALEDLDPEKLRDAESLLHELRVIRDSPLSGNILNSSPFSEASIAAQEEEESSWNTAIPMGFPMTDAKFQGGLRPGELTLLVAPTNKGKSMILISVAVTMAKLGYRVLYVALDNPRHEMDLRVQESALGASKFKADNFKEFCRELRGLKDGAWEGLDPNMQLFLVSRSDFARRPTALDVQSMIAAIEMKKQVRDYDIARGTMPDRVGKVDVCIVDYLDRMKPLDLPNGAATYEKIAQTSADLQELGIVKNIPVLSASQVNRTGYGLDDPDLTHLAGSFDKAAPAGVIGILCQTPEEEKMCKFRMAWTKLRRGVAPFETHFGFNREITRVWEQEEHGSKDLADKKIAAKNKNKNKNKAGINPNHVPIKTFIKTQNQRIAVAPALLEGKK